MPADARIGIGYGSLIGFVGWGAPLMGGLFGAIHGLAIAAIIGLLELSATRTRLGRRLEQAPLPAIVPVKAVIYGVVILLVEAGDLGERVIAGRPSEAALGSPFLPLSIVFSLLFTFGFIFVLQIGRIVGGRTHCAISCSGATTGRAPRSDSSSSWTWRVRRVSMDLTNARVGAFTV